MRRLRARCRGERGSLAIEIVLIAPILLLLLGLLAAYGRVARVNGIVEAGARDAARAATQSRGVDEAEQRAASTLQAALSAVPACRDSVVVDVQRVVSADALRVTATCTYSVRDLGLPGLPGTLTARSTFSSPVDPNRGDQDLVR